MSNINQAQNLFALDTVQDLDDETAATCTGGAAYVNGPNPDLFLYKDPNGTGGSLGVNAATNDGIPNVGADFNDKTSSITINRGVWEFYENAQYNNKDSYNPYVNRNGQSVVLGPGNYNLGANNEKITSIKRLAA